MIVVVVLSSFAVTLVSLIALAVITVRDRRDQRDQVTALGRALDAANDQVAEIDRARAEAVDKLVASERAKGDLAVWLGCQAASLESERDALAALAEERAMDIGDLADHLAEARTAVGVAQSVAVGLAARVPALEREIVSLTARVNEKDRQLQTALTAVATLTRAFVLSKPSALESFKPANGKLESRVEAKGAVP